jgi:predicted PurR-regulated permease PerM
MIKPGGEPPVKANDHDSARWFRHALAVMAAIALALVTWQLTQLLLLLFASILAAVMIHDFAHALMRWTKLPFAGAIVLAVLLPLLVLVIVFGLFGTIMYGQFAILAEQLPEQIKELTAWLNSTVPGREALAVANSYAPKVESVLGIAQSALSNIGAAASGLAIVVVAGVYLAAQPALYIDSLVGLLSPPRAVKARASLGAAHNALTSWLKAQAVGMAFVAVGTSVGLSLVGMPSGLALGLVAGLCEFVPYLGVILVSLPAVLIGFGIDAQTGWLTVAVLVIVQQVQGNIVSPLAQRRMADLPPALTIFSLIGFGMLCGPMGVVLAVPLTVVAIALIKANRSAAH